MAKRVFTSWFIILGLCALLFYTLIPTNQNEFVQIVKNLLNAIGSILLVGGIFEIMFKEKFISEVSESFVKTIFLDSNSLNHFKYDELFLMQKSIQNKLLNGNKTEYTQKILDMINDSFFAMARGKHKTQDFNTHFQYYNSFLYVNKKKNNSNKVEIEYEIKYEVVNNTLDENGHLLDIELEIFSKRFFPLALSQEENSITQELVGLTIKADDTFKDYKDEIKNQKFQEITVEIEEQDSVKIQEDIKRQIQFKKDVSTFETFKMKFKKSMIVEKKIKIITMYNDIGFYHTFKRPTLNYSMQYHDENVNTDTKDYLTMRLFSGLSKKPNDKIHPVLKGKVISLHVSDGILLPGEGICVVALREKFMG